MSVPRPLVLVILDGFGEREAREDNAIRLAKMPTYERLVAEYPHAHIGTSGPDVGLPPGQMGNSEVGHLNFGAGRVAMMDISRIDNAVFDGSLGDNREIAVLLEGIRARKGRLHLIGLVSDGGVHSSLGHLVALIGVAKARGVSCVVHAFLDGRDTAPSSAQKFVAEVERAFGSGGAAASWKGVFGTVSGRFYGMDRDQRWERVEKAYRAIAQGNRAQGNGAEASRREGTNPEGHAAEESSARKDSAEKAIADSYAAGLTDEFVLPVAIGDYDGVRPEDGALHFNFRPDRARELSRALASSDFFEFARVGNAPPFSAFVCMTTYDAKLGLPVAFPKDIIQETFGEILSRAGLKQFRCAETEKYAHVTYFFNGGREEPFAGEERVMIPSPKEVATYDLKPAMSAEAVADAVVTAVKEARFDFVLVNFANPDMVGHSGKLDATIAAVETVDHVLSRIVSATLERGGAVLVTADHGNCEMMKDPVTGLPHTAHTTNPVPFLFVTREPRPLREHGKIADIAPTMLELLGIPQPAAMTGVSLFKI